MAPKPLRLLVALVRAAVALCALLAGLVAAPFALLRWGAVPRSLPTWTGVQDFFSGPVDDRLLLTAITLVGLAAWACFALSCLVEIGALLRRRATPRLRGLGAFQGAAGFLIGAVVLIAPVASSVSAVAATPAVAATALHHAGSPTVTGEHTEARGQGVKQVTVTQETPLWDLAQQHLGDGRRWREIADLNPGLADGGSAPKGAVVRLPASATVQESATGAAAKDTAPSATGYTVRPGDTLSAIAQRKLGDANDWPSIYALNRGEVQPNGHAFDDANLIFPRQHLDLPHQDTTSSPARPAAPPAATAPARTHTTRPEPASPSVETPGTTTPAAPAAATPEGRAGSATPPASGSSTPDRTRPVTEVTSAHEESRRGDLFAGGGLLAASVLAALASRRILQQRRRRPGRRIAMPRHRAAGTEVAMRTVQAPEGLEYIDAALRTAAVHLAAAGRELPDPVAVVYGGRGLTLHLAHPAPPVPPFSAPGGNLARWHAPTASSKLLAPEELGETDAPYPALVTLGLTPDGETILVDLERYGMVRVTGPRRRQVLQALAVELATSTLADHLDIAVLGAACPGLAALLPERCAEHDDPAAAVQMLAGHHAGQRQALASARAASLRGARLGADTPASWTPRIILAAEADAGAEVIGQLAAITEETPRTATAVVTAASNTDGAGRGWTLVADGRPVRLPDVDLDCVLQELSAQDYADVLDIIAASAPDTPDVPASEPERYAAEVVEQVADLVPTAPEAGEEDASVMAAFADLGDDVGRDVPGPGTGRAVEAAAPPPSTLLVVPAVLDGGSAASQAAGPVVRVLGPVDVVGAGQAVEQRYLRTVTEIAAWMVLHPGLDHRALDEAIWPGREVSRTTRNPWISRLRSWLGAGPDGAPHLPPIASTADARYRLADTVTSDWQQFEELVADGTTLGLHRALKLVRGRPFAGIRPRRYVWAEPLMQDMISAIVDVAGELAERYLEDGSPRPAIWAATIGLSAAPESEQLYRALFRAHHAIGDTAGLERAALRLDELNDALGCDMEDATAEILHRLLSPA